MKKHNYIREYYDKIQGGEIIACKRIKQIYKALVEELDNPVSNWIFDIEKANEPIWFIETFCKNSKGKWMGKNVKLLLWQKAAISAIFGFVDKKTGLRRAREAFIECPRKCGKSTLLSGLGIYGMLSEHGAQVLCSANKYQQARIIFDESRNMVLQSPELSKIIRKRKSDMYCDDNFSSMIPLSKNSELSDGLNASLALIDEVHSNKDRYSYDVIKQSMSAREQPLIITISTAGFVRNGLFDILHDYGCNILDGKLTDKEVPYGSFLPFFYELDDVSEMDNPDMWIKANPSLGVIKSFDELKANVERAKVDSTFLPTLKTKDFDIPENVAGSWLTHDEVINPATFELNDFSGSYGIGGVDLSEVGDLTCATMLMMHGDSDVKYIYQHYFMPELAVKEHLQTDKVPYAIWHKRGLITFCKGNRVDYADVTQWFIDIEQKYHIIPSWIGYDRWGTQYWQKEMESRGYVIVPVGQGYKSCSPVMKQMQLDFGAHLINYDANPITAWCLSNTAVKTDPSGNIKFDKSANRYLRIDGMASLYDACYVLYNNFDEYKQLIKGR
jgi:phage terminase large subunit-like protein